jgi:hypothetical protein
MASPSAVGARHLEVMREVAEILERHDDEVGKRIRKAKNGGSIPGPYKSPAETMAYHAECMLSLTRIVDEPLTPKKRGRPQERWVTDQRTCRRLFARRSPSWWECPSRKAGRDYRHFPVCSHQPPLQTYSKAVEGACGQVQTSVTVRDYTLGARG